MLVLVTAGSLVVVACGGTTAEDRERLELLKNDPLFNYTPPGQTRNDITRTFERIADGDSPIRDTATTGYSVYFALRADDDFAVMRQIETIMIDQAWQDLVATCSDATVSVFGMKEFDGFIAQGGSRVFRGPEQVDPGQTQGSELRLTMSAPYHSETGAPIEGHPPDTDCLHQTDD
jgi:hypothetical protein